MKICKSFTIQRCSLIIVYCLIFCGAVSCTKDNGPATPVNYSYTVPQYTSDGWDVSSLSDEGMNEQELAGMMNFILGTENHRIHGIIIIKNGKLVFEEYFKGNLFDTNEVESEGPYIPFHRDTLHYMASVSKSVTSALYGIAGDEGLVGNVSEKLLNYYPEYSSVLTGQKEDITVEHFLAMSAGLAWDESSVGYGDPANDVTALFYSADPTKYILEKSLETAPGTAFHYNSGYANVLAEIIRRQYGSTALDYARVKLFEPLQIEKFRWDMIHSRYLFASGGLYLKPRDIAKIGQLYLNGGTWKGQRIVSQEWVDASVESFINPGASGFANGYGYQWWLNTFYVGGGRFDCFMAVGWGDQLMYVFPEGNLVVVFTCGNFYHSAEIPPHHMVSNNILPALSD